MPGLHDLIREYGELLAEESRISERKERLRTVIAQEMAGQNLRSTSTEHGSAVRTSRFKLLPRPEPVLGLLSSEDLFSSRTSRRHESRRSSSPNTGEKPCFRCSTSRRPNCS